MGTLFLHVGPHKTGSTYLQDALASQSAELQKQGVVYPLAGREFMSGHHNLAWYYMGGTLREVSLGEIKKKIEKLTADTGKNILLSSENFCRMSPDALRRMAEDFQGFDKVKILYFKRSGSKYAYSLWQEIVKHGSVIPLNKLCVDDIVRFFTYNPFNPEEKIGELEHAFGTQTTIIDYHGILQKKMDLLDAISVELDIKLTPSGNIVNASMWMEVIELIRAANLYALSIGKPGRGLIYVVCIKALKRVDGLLFMLYLKFRTAKLKSSYNSRQLAENGFPFPESSNNQHFSYIEDGRLFDVLNKDNLPIWKKIKSEIYKLQSRK